MDYTGIFFGYKQNRQLTDEERAMQLRQKQRLDIRPMYELAVVRMNSTFLDSVDRYYAWRGISAAFMYAMIGGYGFITVLGVVKVAVKWASFDSDKQIELQYAGVAVAIMTIPMFFLFTWTLLKEAFTLTHFPIRLNRRSGKVYVFRPVSARKPVLVADWDRLFFTFGRCRKGVEPGQNWDIRAHVLAEDGKTVLDTFSFSVFMNERELDGLRAHWEFLRRYMEEGPREAYETVKVCLPIADRRETLRCALNRFYLNFKGGLWLWIMLMPLWLVCVLARWISGLTCRIPKWPQAIENECRIEPGDPYVRDASMNPANAWEF